MGLPYGEEIMILGRTMWTQSTSVTDRRTDRQTDRITIIKTVQTVSNSNYITHNWNIYTFLWIAEQITDNNKSMQNAHEKVGKRWKKDLKSTNTTWKMFRQKLFPAILKDTDNLD